jgi:basic amino acid/polyamine antiporter, APA family
VPDGPTNEGLKREIGFFTATILVIANMIGTGIFTTSGFIIQELGSPQTMLLCWFVGGAFALCGALCYGELGSLFPRAGGEYVFLRESFGKPLAFLSGWISLIVGFSAPIAAAAIAFATYLFRTFSIPAGPGIALPSGGFHVITLSPCGLVAIAVIILFSLVHYHSVLMGSRIQNALTLFKVGIIVAFVVAGLWWGSGSTDNFSGGLDLGSVFQGRFAVSLIFISFAYSGWNAAAYLGGEIKNPERNIPLALFAGTFIVMCLYLLLNAFYIYALPVKQMVGVMEVGAAAAGSLFGERMSRLFSGAIALGLLSVLSAMILTGPRVYYAMARDRVFFGPFGRVNRARGTPAHSIFLQAGIAVLMVITASFDKLLIYIGFTLSLCAMLTVAGLMWLRIKRPDLKAAYRTFGYPVTPLLFIMGNLWIIYFSITSRPVSSLFGLGTIAAGIIFYLYFSRTRSAPPEPESTV